MPRRRSVGENQREPALTRHVLLPGLAPIGALGVPPSCKALMIDFGARS